MHRVPPHVNVPFGDSLGADIFAGPETPIAPRLPPGKIGKVASPTAFPDETIHGTPESEAEDRERKAGAAGAGEASRLDLPLSPQSARPKPCVRPLAAGKRESPDDGTEFIKSRYGIEITKQMFSSYKTQDKARNAKHAGDAPKSKPGRKPKAASPAVGRVTRTAREAAAGNDEGDLLGNARSSSLFIAQHGADRVKRLVDLLGLSRNAGYWMPSRPTFPSSQRQKRWISNARLAIWIMAGLQILFSAAELFLWEDADA